MAGARNVKAARALLADYEGDVEKLKAGEPWLFDTASTPAQAGAMGLSDARDHGRGRADEALARHHRASRGQGVTDGKQHRMRKELHSRPGQGLQAGSMLDVPELAAPHGAQGGATPRRS